MTTDYRIVLRSSFVIALCVAIFALMATAANAQDTNAEQTAQTVAVKTTTTHAPPAAAPLLTDYKGVSIGMSADEAREKLDHLKEKGKVQDFFIFSDEESAQVYYDAQGKVTAISVNYVGDESNAPKPEAVIGEAIQAKPDGSMYELKRYPAAGYWVAYSRTAGKNPIITVTMQKIQ
ncbi:MAG: hypothetical protein WCB68_19075 [Pyrinomonadaceae bacterium]